MKIIGLFILCSVSLLCCCSRRAQVANDGSANVLAFSRDDGGKPVNCVDGDNACRVYEIFFEYVEMSKKRASPLKYFSSDLKDEELSDLLTSSDANVLHNRDASNSLFNFGARVNSIYSHRANCGLNECRLNLEVSAGPERLTRGLLIDYVLSEDRIPLIKHVTVDLGDISEGIDTRPPD